jgi:hypothetical protein
MRGHLASIMSCRTQGVYHAIKKTSYYPSHALNQVPNITAPPAAGRRRLHVNALDASFLLRSAVVSRIPSTYRGRTIAPWTDVLISLQFHMSSRVVDAAEDSTRNFCDDSQ